MGKKLTPEQIEALIADYEAWNRFDPDETRTADDIAAAHGISKQTMYTYINSRKRKSASRHIEDEVAELREKLAQMQEANLFLTTELMLARAALEAERRKNGAST